MHVYVNVYTISIHSNLCFMYEIPLLCDIMEFSISKFFKILGIFYHIYKTVVDMP